jgi:hypothetical protein
VAPSFYVLESRSSIRHQEYVDPQARKKCPKPCLHFVIIQIPDFSLYQRDTNRCGCSTTQSLQYSAFRSTPTVCHSNTRKSTHHRKESQNLKTEKILRWPFLAGLRVKVPSMSNGPSYFQYMKRGCFVTPSTLRSCWCIQQRPQGGICPLKPFLSLVPSEIGFVKQFVRIFSTVESSDAS